jgi:flagellar biogenesis protein FliO
MNKSKFFCGVTPPLRQNLIRLTFVGCAFLLTGGPFSLHSQAQTPPPAPQDMSAWQPPTTAVTAAAPVAPVTPTAPALASRPTFAPAQTKLTNLQPPRDIFTQPSRQPQTALAARPLNDNLPRLAENAGFDLQNAMTEAFGDSVSQANLQSQSPFSDSFPSHLKASSTPADQLSQLADAATEKLGGVKDWVSDQAGGIFATDGSQGGWLERLSGMLGGADLKKIGGSLSIVIGGYLGLVWLLRKINPAGNQGIPTEVLEVVGNAPLDSRQNLQLVRLGSKLLLMIHGPEGTQPIGEVTDPAEVDHLVALCNGRTRTANSAVNHAVNRYQSNPAGVNPLNLSAAQQSNLAQLLSVFDQSKRGNASRSFEA